MADIQANIGIGVDTSQALAAIRQLQREISVFHTLMAKGGAAAAAKSMAMQQGLINTINETGKFSASMTRISSSTESFTNALEKNKLSMGQYFRYAGGASKTFGKMFTREFNTINKVATERVKDLQTQYISMGRDANGALQSIKVRPLALDMDNLGTKVQLAAQKQQIFNQLMKQGTTNLLNFGKNTQWAGRQLMVGFTIPLTIFGATAAREFQKLEEQAVKFRRVYGDMFTTDADTEKALSNVRELAEEFTKYGIAVEKTIGLAAKVAQMGNVGTDLTEQVTQATRLAVLGGLEQEQALDTTISLTNAFGIAAEDLAGKIAFLNAAENQTILSIEDFNEAIPKAGSVVQQLGGSVEDLAFFLTAMREGGINASQGANALKTSLARLIAPTEVAKKEMAGFGIDIVGIVEQNAGNLKQTVIELGQELDSLDPLNRARAIEQLFGKFQFARMSTMFQNIAKEGSQANRVLDLTTNSMEELAIIAERELKAVEESPAFKLQKQMEQLKASLAPIGEEFIKAVGPLIEFGTKLLKSFNNLGEGGKQFIVILTAIAGVIAPAALMGFGLIANGVANLLKFFLFLGNAFGRLSGQSTMLGGQTEYMTQQQLEAAAVAASLGQSHSNLTQIFTAEASAISRLVDQYRAAIVAQRQLSIGQTAAGVAARGGARPRGFAKGGIIRGPGTETSDSIIAMLSDGEAVIPAKQVKKYGAVVEQLISGNIPGYAFGEVVGGPGTYRAVGPSAIMAKGNTASSPIDMSWLAQSPIAPISTASAIKTQRESATGTGYDDISAEGQAAVEYAGQRLQQHAQNTESFVDAAQQAYQDTLKYLQEQVAANKMSAQEAEEIATATRVTLAPTKEDVLAGEVAFPRQGLEERDGAIVAGKPRDERKGTSNKKRARNRLRRELESSGYGKEEAFDIAEDRELSFAHVQDSIKLSQEEAEGLGLDTTPTLRDKSEKLPQELDLLERKKAGEKVSRGTPLASSESELQALEQEAASIGTNIVRSNLDAQESEAGIGSPAKRFIEIGRNIVNSTAMGMQEEATEQTGKPPLPGNLAAPKPPMQPETPQPGRFGKFFSSAKDKINESKIAQRAADYLSGEDLTDKITLQPGMSDAEREAHRTAKAINQDLFDKGLITEDMQATPLGQTQGITPVRVVDGKIDIGDNTVDQLANASPAANDAAEQDRLKKANRDQRAAAEAATEATEDLAKAGEQKAKKDEAALKEDKRQNRASLAGKMMMGLGSVTMAAGIASGVEGPVGEVARAVMPVAGGLTAILPTLTALGPVLGTLLGIAGALVAGFFLLKGHLEKVRKEAFNLAKAMGVGSEAMQKFADYAGTVSRSEVMDRQREQRLSPMQVQPGQTTFGQGFVGSEQGQELVQSVRSGLEKLGQDSATRSLFLQLGTAVSQGIMTPEQARSIAGALAIELDNLELGIDLNSQLLNLLGPNGENLLEDPLSIGVILAGEVQKDLEDQMAKFNEVNDMLGNGGITAGYLGAPDLMSEDAQGLVDQERQRQVDASEGFWSELWAKFKPTGMVLSDIRAANLGRLSASLVSSFENVEALMDTARAASEDRIQAAIAEGKTFEEVQELRSQEADSLRMHTDALALAAQDILSTFGEMDVVQRNVLLKDQTERIVEAAPSEEKAGLRQGMTALADTEQFTQEQRLVVQTAIEAGDINSQTLLDLVENPERVPVIVDMIGKVGSGESKQILQMASSIKDEALQQEFIMNFSGEDSDGILERVKEFEYLTRTSALFGGVDIPISYFENNSEALDDLMLNAEKFRLMSNGEDGINMDMYAQVYGADLATQLQESILANQEEFDAIDPSQQIEYGILFALQAQLAGDEQALGYLDNLFPELTGAAAGGKNVLRVLPSMTDATKAVTGDEEGTAAGGGGTEPQIDSLIKKLRDLRLATVDMKKGWEGMQETLNSIFAGGTQQMDMFNGLEKQIRNLGIGEGLIAQIVGMDPDEYEKRKNELFEFDGLGNIVKAKGALLNMNEAFNAVAIGEYVNGQEQFIQKTKDQMSAIRILTSNGMSLADAYDAVQDAALAAAIAQGASRKEIEEILRITQLAKELEEGLEEQRERSRISEAVRKTNEEFSNQVAILQKLSKAQGQYSDEQVKAIMGDSDLQKLFLDPSIDPKALEAALRNAEERANLEVQIAIAEGREDELFGQYLTEVNDYFSREEAVIDVNFEMDTADESKIIEDAQRQIDAIQYQLDDYNAELEQISWSEEDINEKYDKRIEALDEIADANKKIADQQKAQLDIADALSRGDIAAAARATAELRSQQASDAQQSQKEQLDRAREAELKQLTGPSGMTREQLEDAITSLERQVFQLEETALEPAQERVRLAEITRDLAIEQLELNGMTRDEFDQIAASTNLAALNMEDMVKSAEKLVAMGEFIRTGTKPANWEELFPTPKATPAPAKPSGGGGGGGSSSAPAPAPTPSPSGPTVKERSAEWSKNITDTIRNLPSENSAAPVVLTPVPKPGALTAKMGTPTPAKKLTASSPEVKQAIALSDKFAKMGRAKSSGGLMKYAMGGKVGRYANGGMIIPKRMAMGGYSMGSDTIPAILTPGEFVVRRPAVSAFGVDNLEKINRGTYNDGSVYNYNLAVNVKSDSDPNRIARAVITNIKSIENQRIRGNKL